MAYLGETLRQAQGDTLGLIFEAKLLGGLNGAVGIGEGKEIPPVTNRGCRSDADSTSPHLVEADSNR